MELKLVCDRLKILGNELIQFESKKIQAIEGEDFESAKYIKGEIHRIRKELEQIDPHHPLNKVPSSHRLKQTVKTSATVVRTMDESINQR